jgi:hypothetical protein
MRRRGLPAPLLAVSDGAPGNPSDRGLLAALASPAQLDALDVKLKLIETRLTASHRAHAVVTGPAAGLLSAPERLPSSHRRAIWRMIGMVTVNWTGEQYRWSGCPFAALSAANADCSK